MKILSFSSGRLAFKYFVFSSTAFKISYRCKLWLYTFLSSAILNVTEYLQRLTVERCIPLLSGSVSYKLQSIIILTGSSHIWSDTITTHSHKLIYKIDFWIIRYLEAMYCILLFSISRLHTINRHILRSFVRAFFVDVFLLTLILIVSPIILRLVSKSVLLFSIK